MRGKDLNIEDFAAELHQTILVETEGQVGGEFQENVFTGNILGWLVDIGECMDPEVAFFKGPGMKLNAWDLSDDRTDVDLFVTVFEGTEPVPKIPKSEITEAAARCRKFLARAMAGLWHGMEESAPAYTAARELAEHASDLRRARIFVLANGTTNMEALPNEKVDEVQITHYLWDMEHIYQVFAGNAGPAPIDISERELNGGLRCVKCLDENAVYDTYVGVIRGDALADIYERWGQRLLERNLRSFLQTRGKINKEIQRTLREGAGMFLAYNNGISTTAESVEVEQQNGTINVKRMLNFQIVNGGQTTASLSDARRKYGVDLSRVSVQIKIIVLKDAATLDAHVPLIARYANSQNKVNVSDFSANHPFHVALERLSRAKWVPKPDQRGKSTTKWYYERARGQYLNDVLKQSSMSTRNAFKIEYPTRQKLTKTAVAKHEMCWLQYPHIVSSGAEKNFSHFMLHIGDEIPAAPDERYFTHMVAKTILFRRCDELVQEAAFPGYKANIVAYSIAYLSHRTGMGIDLDRVWVDQAVPGPVEEALRRTIHLAQGHVMTPPREGMNLSEWCKKEECWRLLREKDLDLPDLREMMWGPAQRPVVPQPGPAEVDGTVQAAWSSPPTMLPAEDWFGLAAWGKKTGVLNNTEKRVAFRIGLYISKGWPVSPRMAAFGQQILDKATSKGFAPGATQP